MTLIADQPATSLRTPPSGPDGASAAADTDREVSGSRRALDAWVANVAARLTPDRVIWCDGSEAERQRLIDGMLLTGTLVALDAERRPGSYLARTDPGDVARVESSTFICSATAAEAGPNNNWRDPAEMRAELDRLLAGSMRGRTMYVLPFSMGPVGSPLARLGVQVTDSPYVAVSTGVMTRMGAAALARIDAGESWTPGVHTVGAPLAPGEADAAWPCNPVKVIAHFPETREIVSYGSGYGGNAILAKKCLALRIGSVIAREEGWLAEHMLLVRVTAPTGRRFHLAAAFPSACGKTNFAMMQPTLPGWRVETIGDDIAWLAPGADGRLRAINPEAGVFGVAPGTGARTNPVAMAAVAANTVFTNVAIDDDGDVWWEGMDVAEPAGLTDWRGRRRPRIRTVGGAGVAGAAATAVGPAAHPNGRFTAPLTQVPSLADDWDDPAGVPVDAILLGGRRSDTVPLVTEARDWAQGVFMGATMSSTRTAAAEGTVGELRFDPFAMQPFCGYDLGEHWAHWLSVGERLGAKAPRVFRVNWFLRGDDGGFLWPGFGDNIRVVDWIVRRLSGAADASPSPIGLLPKRCDLDLAGLDLSARETRALTALDPEAWYDELPRIRAHFAGYGDTVPDGLRDELQGLERGLWQWIC